jgi:hypothetical protein
MHVGVIHACARDKRERALHRSTRHAFAMDRDIRTQCVHCLLLAVHPPSSVLSSLKYVGVQSAFLQPPPFTYQDVATQVRARACAVWRMCAHACGTYSSRHTIHVRLYVHAYPRRTHIDASMQTLQSFTTNHNHARHGARQATYRQFIIAHAHN